MKRILATIAILSLASGAARATGLTFGGGGEYVVERDVPCLTNTERAQIQARLEASRDALEVQGLLPPAFAPQSVALGWPLRLRVGNDPGCHGISNFVDENPANPGQILDYNCGTRTYDQAGYNHAGTDFFTWPFGWYKMDNQEVEIVAAADGWIIGKDDGNFDRSCSLTGANWNAVYVQHTDGSVAWYGHMKNGSLTPKFVGETVVQGEYLGIVGSSGNSTGPHLHFELHDSSNQIVDPWGGPCNSLGGVSWWADQRPYYDSAVNALYTHSAAPVFPSCPTTETPNRSDTFTPGQAIYVAAYYRDQMSGQQGNYRVYDAVGNLFDSWSHSSPAAHYTASYWYWFTMLPASGLALGKWRFEVDFQGQTTSHDFYVVSTTAVEGRDAPKPELARLGANPGSGRVDMEMRLPQSGYARLSIFDVAGHRVARVLDGWQPAGSRRVSWDPGAGAAGSGLYLAALECAAGRVEQKICVLR